KLQVRKKSLPPSKEKDRFLAFLDTIGVEGMSEEESEDDSQLSVFKVTTPAWRSEELTIFLHNLVPPSSLVCHRRLIEENNCGHINAVIAAFRGHRYLTTKKGQCRPKRQAEATTTYHVRKALAMPTSARRNPEATRVGLYMGAITPTLSGQSTIVAFNNDGPGKT
ncbi:12471_t:CDS:2, partial [Acaulospora colombiana]